MILWRRGYVVCESLCAWSTDKSVLGRGNDDMKKAIKIIQVAVICSGVLVFFLAINFWSNSTPRANTPEYDQAHGIVRGEDNLITVGGVKLLIPALTYFRVYSYENIEKGKADKVVLSILLDELFERDVDKSYGSPAKVRIEIKKDGVVQDPNFVQGLDRIKKGNRSESHLEDIGLIEYADDKYEGGEVLYLTTKKYSGFRENVPMLFSCNVNLNGEITLCMTLYIPYKGLDISFYFNGKDLMPHWRYVTRRVHEYVDGLIIEG